MAPVLGYWSIRGLAQPIRYLLEFTGTKYEDKQFDCGPAPTFDRSEWTNIKNTLGLEFPNLPYYIDGDLTITESSAILRHLASKNNLEGSTEKEKVKVNMAVGIMTDLGEGLSGLFYGPNFEAAKPGFIANVNSSLQKVSKILGSQNYVTGDKISFADFMLFELLERFELLVPTCLSGFNSLQAFKIRFMELPGIKTYLASPSFQNIKDRFNGRTASLGAGTY